MHTRIGNEPVTGAAAKVSRAFERLERQKSDMLAKLSRWTEEQKHFRVDAGSWSALHVIDHLVKVERESLAAIRANLPDGKNVGVREKIRAQAVFAVMRSRMRVKVPSAVLIVLPDDSPVEETMLDGWRDVRRDLQALLSSLEPRQLNCGLFHHPVSGPMTIPYAINFLSVHMAHHDYQLDRIRKVLPY